MVSTMTYSSEASLDLVRADFPLTKKKVYMNNGSVAPTPLSTIKAITDAFLKYSIEGPDSKAINEFITLLMKELRNRIADLINCESEEIIFPQRTTEGINYVRNGIDWRKGDSVVIRGRTHEHYANYLPWLQLSKNRGVSLVDLPINSTGYFDIADLEEALSLGKIRQDGNRLREGEVGRGYNSGILKGSNKTKRKMKDKKTTPKLITLSHALYNNG